MIINNIEIELLEQTPEQTVEQNPEHPNSPVAILLIGTTFWNKLLFCSDRCSKYIPRATCFWGDRNTWNRISSTRSAKRHHYAEV